MTQLLPAYGEEWHPISPSAIGSRIVLVVEGGGIGEEDESDKGEQDAEGLDDGLDVPFPIMLAQQAPSVLGDERAHRAS